MNDNFEYLIDIRDLNDIKNVKELSDILFDNYMIDSEIYSKYILKVFIYTDEDKSKLISCLKKFNVSNKCISDIINNKNINESKNKLYDMRNSIEQKRRLARKMFESKTRRSSDMYRHEINESRRIKEMIFNNPYDPIFEAKDDENSMTCKCRFNGKLISKMSKPEQMAARKKIREELHELKAILKNDKKEGKSTKMVERKIEKLQMTLDCLMGRCSHVDESVNSKFDRMRKMFEAEETDEVKDDEVKDDEPTPEDEPAPEDDVKDDNTEETENVELDAVVLSIEKKNLETIKAELVEAGVNEDDIDVIDDDADDDDEIEIKISVNSISALNSYLEGVGIDLQKELGGELIFDDEVETEDADDTADDVKDDAAETDKNAEDDDFDQELEDLF